MTYLASFPLFSLVIYVAISAVALAAVVLAVLMVRDWWKGKLW